MRIATFNANSIRTRIDIVLDWIADHQPDVLAIQETKVVDELFPKAAFEAAGYHVTFKGQKAYNGVAIASRHPPTAIGVGLDDGGPADESRLLYARIDGVHVVNTYVPQGREIDHEMYGYKLAWFARLRQYFDRHFTPRQKVVWLGDLNVGRHPIDLHNPERQGRHVCYHEDCRAAFEATLDWGFCDVFRQHHPEPGHYSWFDYRTRDVVERNMGWRIDYILATPPMARRSTDAYIDIAPRKRERPSDHTFVVADFDL